MVGTPRRRGRRRRGAALAETAIVISIFMMLVLGMIEMSQMCLISHMVTTAAGSACRVATIGNYTQSDVTSTVSALLTGAGVKSSTFYTLTTSPTDVTSARFGTPISVTISVPFKKVSWLGAPLFLGSTTITSTTTMSSERP